jgi:hypothetical protein
VVALTRESAKEKSVFRGVVDWHGVRLGDGPDGGCPVTWVELRGLDP